MKKYVPINKKTGQRYPAVDADGKAAYENDPNSRDKFDFEEKEVADAPKAEKPENVKAAEPKETKTNKE